MSGVMNETERWAHAAFDLALLPLRQMLVDALEQRRETPYPDMACNYEARADTFRRIIAGIEGLKAWHEHDRASYYRHPGAVAHPATLAAIGPPEIVEIDVPPEVWRMVLPLLRFIAQSVNERDARIDHLIGHTRELTERLNARRDADMERVARRVAEIMREDGGGYA